MQQNVLLTETSICGEYKMEVQICDLKVPPGKWFNAVPVSDSDRLSVWLSCAQLEFQKLNSFSLVSHCETQFMSDHSLRMLQGTCVSVHVCVGALTIFVYMSRYFSQNNLINTPINNTWYMIINSFVQRYSNWSIDYSSMLKYEHVSTWITFSQTLNILSSTTYTYSGPS